MKRYIKGDILWVIASLPFCAVLGYFIGKALS
jgi:hypothetical protein